jgi:ATP-dependent Clp protease ATP-binding subunit ClpB
MQVDSKPEELDNFDREIVRLKIEAEALKKETDAASKDRLVRLQKELAGLDERSREITARWQGEKDKLGRAADIKTRLDGLRNDLATAVRQTLLDQLRLIIDALSFL